MVACSPGAMLRLALEPRVGVQSGEGDIDHGVIEQDCAKTNNAQPCGA